MPPNDFAKILGKNFVVVRVETVLKQGKITGTLRSLTVDELMAGEAPGAAEANHEGVLSPDLKCLTTTFQGKQCTLFRLDGPM